MSYLYAIINEAPSRLSEKATGISAELDNVLKKVLDKDRDARYQEMRTVIEDLTKATTENSRQFRVKLDRVIVKCL